MKKKKGKEKLKTRFADPTSGRKNFREQKRINKDCLPNPKVSRGRKKKANLNCRKENHTHKKKKQRDK